MGFIYRLIFPDNKSCVGQTTQTVEKRIQMHKCISNTCTALKKAIEQYKTFEVETLLEVNDELLDLLWN